MVGVCLLLLEAAPTIISAVMLHSQELAQVPNLSADG